MKIKTLFYLIVLMLLIFACNKRPTSNVDFSLESFKITDSITDGNIYCNSNLFLANPRWLKYHPDSFLIISELTKTSKFIKIIDLKTNMIQEMIPSGKGPGEMITAWGIGIIDKKIWVFDGQLHKICILKEDKNRIFSIESEFSLKEKTTMGIYVMNDSLIACLSGIEDKKNRLTFCDFNGNIVKKTGTFPKLKNNSEIESDNNIFMSAISSPPKGNIVILACVSTDIFEIYNFNNGLIKRIQGPLGIELTAKKINIGMGYMMGLEPRYSTFYNIACSDTAIWISYNGRYFNKKERPTHDNAFPKNILCFSNNGVPQQVLNFQNNILYFDVDWENKIIYCLEWENENPSIVSYVLK